jgi:hypothetical protein
MFNAKSDNTVHRERIKRLKSLIEEYEQVKEKKHSTIKFVSELFKRRGIKKQNFFKYYHRYKELEQGSSLLPRKRGVKYRASKYSQEPIDRAAYLRRNVSIDTRFTKPCFLTLLVYPRSTTFLSATISTD